MSGRIEHSVQDGIMEIRIDRPDKKNALTAGMYHEMTACLKGAGAGQEIRVILICGMGDAFCAGNDLRDFMQGPQGAQAALDFIRAIASFDKPVVVAVQGLAVGVGTTMLFHCDLVYASRDARFIMPFVDLGLVPEAGSSLLAPALMGYAKASAMLLLGEMMTAEDAVHTGLVTAIIPADQLLDHARAKAAALVTKPAAALAATRRLLKGDRSALLDRIDEEASMMRERLGSQEAQEAFAAFFDKRPLTYRPS